MPTSKLTRDNYFTSENKYLSNSRLSWFAKDKAIFKKYFIDGEYDRKPTDVLIIGNAIDTWLTEGYEEFLKQYTVVTRRNKNGGTDWQKQLNPSQYDQIEKLCQAVERQTVYQSLKGYKRQVLLTYDMPIGEHFCGLCGVLDFLDVQGNTATIVDLKTANSGVNPQGYYYKCLDYGYFRQMAMYQVLTALNYPGLKHIDCYHLVVEKDTDEVFPVHLFRFTEEKLENAKQELDDLISALKNEKDFAPRDTTWGHAIDL